VKIDFVSPLPPVRSGIADYSRDLLPHLAARADVRLIRLPDLPVAPEIEAAWTLAPAEETGSQGRLPLYQMGNNRYHRGVLDLALERPGVLTLHDVFLHHLLLDLTLGKAEFYRYKERLTQDHGWIGEAAALAKRWGAWGEAPVFALPAHRTLLRRQKGVLVHSEWARDFLAEEEVGVPVRAVPMGIPLPPPADPAAGRDLRQRFGLPLDRPVLGSFGFQTPIKRTLAAIRALAAPGLEEVHLLIAGEVAPILDLEGEARRLGVADRVRVAGFLSYADFEAAIAAVDLCLNLRYPTAGETSASLLRVLAVGRPAIVSDYAQFADLPEEVALKVPLGDEEPEALAALLRDLLAKPERLKAIGEAAREHVRRRHDPELAAEAVAQACREWATFTPPDAEPRKKIQVGGLWAAERPSPGLRPVVAEPPAGHPSPTRIFSPDLGSSPAASGAGTLPADHVLPTWNPSSPEVPPPTSLAWGDLPGEMEVAGAEIPWAPGERRRLRIRLRNTGFARWLAGRSGPGGMAVVVKMFVDGEDWLAGTPWLALPRDLAPGAEVTFETSVRRPEQAAHLWIEPHLFGGLGISKMGGPRWESWI
jgi:glycosyltransferase involved in cell wall biosynthesis